MIQETPSADQFTKQLHELLLRETESSRPIIIVKGSQAYNHGDLSESVYFIVSGQVKLTMLSPEGKECLLSIHVAGDIFGELCLSELGVRKEAATAMKDTVVKQISGSKFLLLLEQEKLFEGFIRYLTVRIADQQQAIANLVTVNSEQRLGQILLQLGRTMGKKDPHSILIPLKLSHEELANMVGTTRPRITFFLQRFRNLGLMTLSDEHFFIIKEHALNDYLTKISG